MFVEQLLKKKEESMISGFGGEGAFSLSWLAVLRSLLSFFLYPRKH
jgi:hypothetical protein